MRKEGGMFDKVHFMTADIWQIVTLPKKLFEIGIIIIGKSYSKEKSA